MSFVRFDDLIAGSAFELHDLRSELVAATHDEVREVIDAAEHASRSGSWVAGFVAYEASPAFDPTLRVSGERGNLPLAWFGVFARRTAVTPIKADRIEVGPSWTLDWSRDQHALAIEKIKRRLADGDTYQVNLTMRAHGLATDSFELYRSMVSAQRGAYNAYIQMSTHAVVSSSPELFFELDGEHIVTKPMKGTRRRGRWPAEDRAQAAELQESEKDQAEHVMIVDLIRNDLGRIASPGSVSVADLATLERYQTVWQLTSTIKAEIASGVGLSDTFAALFPSGSVTGAPKRSTMEAIAELETSSRGVYCGAVGFISPSGCSRFAVAIRTATVEVATGRCEYGTGGGITWSSVASEEWDEALAKCAVLEGGQTPTGLFETFGYDPDGGGPGWDLHLDRLAASAEYFAIPFDRAQADKEIFEAVASATQARRVRLQLSGDGSLILTVNEPPTLSSGPVRLIVARERVDSRDVRLFHKTIDRSRYERIRADHPGFDDVVMVNERGEITETTIANIVVRMHGAWWTPPLQSGLLPGIERQRLIERGRLAERILYVSDLMSAEDVAVINSLRGWRQAAVVWP